MPVFIFGQIMSFLPLPSSKSHYMLFLFGKHHTAGLLATFLGGSVPFAAGRLFTAGLPIVEHWCNNRLCHEQFVSSVESSPHGVIIDDDRGRRRSELVETRETA